MDRIRRPSRTGSNSDASLCAGGIAERLQLEGLKPGHPARLTFEVLAASSIINESSEVPSGLPKEVGSLWNRPLLSRLTKHSTGRSQISVDGYPGTGKSTLLYANAQAIDLVPELAVLRRNGSPLDGTDTEESVRISRSILDQEVQDGTSWNASSGSILALAPFVRVRL